MPCLEARLPSTGSVYEKLSAIWVVGLMVGVMREVMVLAVSDDGWHGPGQ